MQQQQQQQQQATRKRSAIARAVDEERKRQQQLLNEQFVDFCARADPLAVWDGVAREYCAYSLELQTRFDDAGGSGDRALFTFGSGDCGQLGHGVSEVPNEDEETSVSRPKKVKALDQPGREVRALASGGLTNAIVDSKGVWTWGCGDEGALGRGGDENFPALLTFPSPSLVVLAVSLGDCHGAVLTMGGQVFAWGSYRDKEGKLWFPTSSMSGGITGPGTVVSSPEEMSGLPKIIAIASGAHHTVVLSADRRAYSFGIGESCQLGRRVSRNAKGDIDLKDAEGEYDVARIHREHLTPGEMVLATGNTTQEGIRSIGCGAYHTLAVSTHESRVYACGLNQYHQVAPASEEKMVPTLERIPGLDGKGVAYVQGGEFYSVALSVDGALFTWGRGDQSQLGRKVESTAAGSFETSVGQVDSVPPIAQVYCGSSHCIALDRDGAVYTWGFGFMNQLGHGQEVDEPLPRKVTPTWGSARPVRVSAGGQHSCILVETS